MLFLMRSLRGRLRSINLPPPPLPLPLPQRSLSSGRSILAGLVNRLLGGLSPRRRWPLGLSWCLRELGGLPPTPTCLEMIPSLFPTHKHGSTRDDGKTTPCRPVSTTTASPRIYHQSKSSALGAGCRSPRRRRSKPKKGQSARRVRHERARIRRLRRPFAAGNGGVCLREPRQFWRRCLE